MQIEQTGGDADGSGASFNIRQATRKSITISKRIPMLRWMSGALRYQSS